MKKLRGIWMVFLFIYLISSAASAQKTASIKTNGSTGDISVNSNIGDIVIKIWDKNEVLAESEDDEEISLSQNGSSVKVSAKSDYGSDIKVTIPRGFNVNAKTNFGDIKIDGHLKGSVELRSTGGDLKINSVEGNASALTEGGDIKAEGEISGNVSFRTSGGDIGMQGSKGNVELYTMGGDINTGEVGGDLTINSMGGNITIHGRVNGNADLKTAGGNIKVPEVSKNASLETMGGNLLLLSAVGNVVAKTYGGNIRLSKVNGSVNALTMAGDVSIELTPGANSTSKIISNNGRIVLYVPESAKTTITAKAKIYGWWGDNDKHSSIQSEFKEAEGSSSKEGKTNTAVYKLNNGGSEIELEVNAGEIQIKKLNK